MSYERWTTWLKKARELKEKYEQNKKLIIKELIKLSPKWFGEYKSKEVLVLLYLLYKIIESQKLLYIRFMNGSELFLSSIGDESYKKGFEEINEKGRELLALIETEERTLSILYKEFKHIAGKIKLKSIEEGIFFTKINESQLRKVSEKLLEFIPEFEEKVIKKVHKDNIIKNNKETYQLHKIRSMVKNIYAQSEILFREPLKTKQVGTVIYLSVYIAFFFELIDYPVFSSVTTMARETMIR